MFRLLFTHVFVFFVLGVLDSISCVEYVVCVCAFYKCVCVYHRCGKVGCGCKHSFSRMPASFGVMCATSGLLHVGIWLTHGSLRSGHRRTNIGLRSGNVGDKHGLVMYPCTLMCMHMHLTRGYHAPPWRLACTLACWPANAFQLLLDCAGSHGIHMELRAPVLLRAHHRVLAHTRPNDSRCIWCCVCFYCIVNVIGHAIHVYLAIEQR